MSSGSQGFEVLQKKEPMTPQEKLKMLNEMLLKQTGKSMNQFDDDEFDDIITNMVARLNNEQILSNALNEIGDSENYAVKMWRQVVPMEEICKKSQLTSDGVYSAIGLVIANLREKHFMKFCKGWKLDVSGEPVSANPPIEVDPAEAQREFDSWMVVLALKSP